MAHFRLPAGTDVAEMALFDIDALHQTRCPDAEGLEELVKQQALVRLPTGADGGYLLHLYVDEPIPDNVMRYCLADDKLIGMFSSQNGRVAFGGVESTYQNFKLNKFIRADADIAPGPYTFTAFHTDISDEILARAIRVENTSRERWLTKLPTIITLTAIGMGFTLANIQRFIAAGLSLILGYIVLKIVKDCVQNTPVICMTAARKLQSLTA